jgi:uncharacterized protein YecT (DUF1311 family)
MMRLHEVLVALAMLLFSGASLAEQPRPENYRAEYDGCVKDATEKGFGGSAALEECTEGITDVAKREMNVLYKRIHDALQVKNATDAVAFEKSQRAWLEYRNMHCDLEQKYIGGPETAICPMDLDIERVNKLRRLSTGL